MKLVRCEWAPSLVVEWLCGELEERGIPGPTYAHTLLSLLHHHYCPHPAPSTPISSNTISSVRYHHPLSRRHLDDFDLRDLDLEDLLGHTTHPDADIPEIASFTPQQRGGSRRARKRYKVRQKQRVLTSEQLQKVAAIQCLMSASDERYDLESLVEELCIRLKTAAEDKHLKNEHSNKKSSACADQKEHPEKVESQESCNESEEYVSSTPEEQAEKYYAAFPPLSGSCKETNIHEDSWLTRDVLCSCVKESSKPFITASSKMPRAYRKKCREKEKRKEVEVKTEGKDGCEASRRHVAFTWHSTAMHCKESYDTDSASEPERGSVERRRKKFSGPLLDEDIGEGYIGDTSSRESSEDRDKGDPLDTEKQKDERYDGRIPGLVSSKVKQRNQEEWECTGNLLLGKENDSRGNQMEGAGSNRLFERGSTSGGTSGSSSDVETSAVGSTDQEAESVRQLERKISDSVAQVWGQASESFSYSRGEHVWDPPAVQEQTYYTTLWGFEPPPPLPEHMSSNDASIIEQNLVAEAKVTPEPLSFTSSNKWQVYWQQKDTIHSATSSLPNDKDPFLCNITNEQSPREISENKESEALLLLSSSFEKASMWSDCNANNISGDDGPYSSCLSADLLLEPPVIIIQKNSKNEDGENTVIDGHSVSATGELESKLSESLMKLGLENLWESTLGLDSMFADLSLSHSNLDFVSGHHSVEEVHGNPMDSEHEKMMALVEDVCKSYESQEEGAQDDSIKHLPSGPSGPQANLRPTENSGFKMVVPRGKSAELYGNSPELSDSLILPLDCSTSQEAIASAREKLDAFNPSHEEENLLTSPRTHFRPIRQESLGSTADDNYEDGTMFVINSERPDLPFQRTSSGSLFLESDLIEGSPKKYMVYKEPPPKITQVEEETSNDNVDGIALVPKFKVVYNEKFCQTEVENESKRKKYSVNETVSHEFYVDQLVCGDDNEPDVFEFQHQDFPGEESLASIWKHNTQVSESIVHNSHNIWEIHLNGEPDAWSLISDIEPVGVTNGGNKVWLESKSATPGWMNNSHGPPHIEMDKKMKSDAVIIPNSLASLWHQDSPVVSPSNPSSLSNAEALWNSYRPQYKEENAVHETSGQLFVIANPNTHIPGKLQSTCHYMSELGTWNQFVNANNRNDNNQERFFMDTHQNLQSEVTDEQRKTSQNFDHPGLCSELRLEVDQEADELLGALNAETVNDLDQSSNMNKIFYGNSYDGRSFVKDPSPLPLHERLRKRSSVNVLGAYSDRSVFPKKEQQEDLDDLAPGWEFNDGFEWDHQPGDEEECADAGPVDDDECEGEVLIYETEDGTTITIPVEYLDDSLYDQIFGTATENQIIGGSLPDLPSGQPSKIHFSSELEEQWKKSGIPYKVQLPRKPRPGRWLPPSRRPCTFFMEGSCRRNDCKFSHDLASITCRFWEEGSCLKGITCPFLHGYPLRRRRNKSEGAVHCSVGEKLDHHGSSFEIDSEQDFPTLGSSVESKTSIEERICTSSGSLNYISNQHNIGTAGGTTKKKKRKFITITKNVLGEMRSADAERALRRRLHSKRERRRRNTEAVHASAEGVSVSLSSTEAHVSKPRTSISRRKAERHRASASGHDDGTVSDYS